MQFKPIAYINTPFHEKFGTPRQPLLIPEAKGQIYFISPFNKRDAIEGLEQFSHLWILFFFNQTDQKGFKLKVRPPRLGGNQKLGVFATRSNFRPNAIGLSVVKLDEILIQDNQLILQVSGVDLINKTPILDIKPYLPYCDSIPNAQAGFAQNAPIRLLNVHFSTHALEQIQYNSAQIQFITKIIEQDPRPAYKNKTSQVQSYGMKIQNYNILFEITQLDAIVTNIELLE